MKRYSLLITSKQAQDLSLSLSDEFKQGNPVIMDRINSILEEDDFGVLKSKGSEEDKGVVSKGHSSIFNIYKKIYPRHRVRQEAAIDLIVDGRKISCRFDIIDHDFKLVIEIQGDHHRKYVPHFHKNLQGFSKQKSRDESKKLWCQEAGWTYIEISDVEARKFGKISEVEAKRDLQFLINQALSG